MGPKTTKGNKENLSKSITSDRANLPAVFGMNIFKHMSAQPVFFTLLSMYYNFKKCYSWYISSESFMVDLLWLLMTDESLCSIYWIIQPLKMQFVEAL